MTEAGVKVLRNKYPLQGGGVVAIDILLCCNEIEKLRAALSRVEEMAAKCFELHIIREYSRKALE